MTDDRTVWEHMRNMVDWLDASNGTGAHETAMRMLKVTEEAGEAAAAYIGLIGQNPRKGSTHTPDDVAAELCDVVTSAIVALHSFTGDPRKFLEEYISSRAERLAPLAAPVAAGKQREQQQWAVWWQELPEESRQRIEEYERSIGTTLAWNTRYLIAPRS